MSTKNLRIGFDLDEVLADFMPTFLNFYESTTGRRIPIGNIRTYNFWENGIGQTREEAISIVDRFFASRFSEQLPVFKGAAEAVEQLSKEGELFVITARSTNIRERTEEFLNLHFPSIRGRVVYTEDFHGSPGKTKAGACREIGIDEFYEDNLRYALECALYVKRVYLFDKPWNQAEVNGNIVRVKSWQEAMQRRIA